MPADRTPDVSREDVAAVQARIEAALLREYPWHDHDQWSDDQDVRDAIARGENPWPHLSHVAEVAADAAVFGGDAQGRASGDA